MTNSSPPNATWYAVKGPNGDLTWRVESPARAVGGKVNYIPDGDAGGDALFWPNRSEFFPWSLSLKYQDGSTEVIQSREAWEAACVAHKGEQPDVHPNYPNHEGDAAVFTRPLAFGAVHLMGLRQQGVRVSAEVDDFYLADADKNVFTKKATSRFKLQGKTWADYIDDHARSICVGDALILSTEHLRDQYWKALRQMFGKRHLPEFFVCRNHVDERFVPQELVPPREDGKLRIGYMGSDSHYWDVELIYPALREAWENGHEIVFVGINPRYSMNEPTAAEIRQRQHWWEIEFTHIPWSDHFRGVALPLDIGFAPLVVNQSTLGKSDIKWMEYALSGAACVAHNCLVYNRTAVDGETALLASSPGEYVHQMRRLILERGLRGRLVENTREYIREERMLMDHADEWKDAVLG